MNRDLALGNIRAGIALAEKRQYDEAVEQFRKAIAIDPQLGEAHFNLAGARFERGDVRAAIDGFREAIRLAPKWAEAHYQLGRALLKAGQRKEAMEEFCAGLKHDTEHIAARQALN